MFQMYKDEIIGTAGKLSAIYGTAYKLGPSEQRVLQSIISWCIENKTDTFIKHQVWLEDKASMTHVGFNKIVRKLEEKGIIKNIGKSKDKSGKTEICRLVVKYDTLIPAARDLKKKEIEET